MQSDSGALVGVLLDEEPGRHDRVVAPAGRRHDGPYNGRRMFQRTQIPDGPRVITARLPGARSDILQGQDNFLEPLAGLRRSQFGLQPGW